MTKLIIPIEHLPKGSHTKIIASCDICNIQYNVPYRDYLNSHEIHNFDTCNKCKFQKSKLTNIEKYGCETPLQNIDILEKYFKTNNERYGGNSSACDKDVFNKQQVTRVLKGLQKSIGVEGNEFSKYRRMVGHYTNKFKKELFEKWDGYDFYDGEYIKDNFNLKSSNRLYPTIDHKISVFYGFMNKINEKEIARLDNLVITKKCINSSKSNKDFSIFKNGFL
jgi:hypothetical protein